MTTKSEKKRASSYYYHPLEFSVCGYSNSGKTTLISKLVKELSEDHRVGYVKHDAHKFSMDTPGKDTDVIKQSGASSIYIGDPKHFAHIADGEVDFAVQKQLFLDDDFVLIEGFKHSTLPKLVMIDSEKKILEQAKSHQIDNILCFIGEETLDGDKILGLPYFQRDQISSIKKFICDFFAKKIEDRPLYGLVLTGGKSSRMKQDKALLKYHGKSQMQHGFDLLSNYCQHVFISSQKNQWNQNSVSDLPIIEDKLIDFGPLAGVLSAMMAHPEAAWMVIACDLPYLEEQTLSYLLDHRDPFKLATAYRSTYNGLPEPLCTIYEPKSFYKLWSAVGHGRKCPRKILINAPTKLIDQQNSQSLENANHPEEYLQAITALKGKSPDASH